MEKIVPLISSGTTGPLGLCHLPRLWLKVLLHATGRLPEGYRRGAAGIDELLLDTIGVNLDEFLNYVSTELPTYVECEQWVREHATKLDEKTITGWNESLKQRDKPVVQLGPQWEFTGITDRSIRGTVLVNDLDDWQTVHDQVTKGEIAPLIASSLHAEFTELLYALRKETDADRVAIRVVLPQWDMGPTRPMTEARRDKSVPSTLERDVTDPTQLGPIEFIARERKIVVTEDMMSPDAMIAVGSNMVTKYSTRARLIGPVFVDDKLVAWITVHQVKGPRKWSDEDVAALARTSERISDLIESVGK